MAQNSSYSCESTSAETQVLTTSSTAHHMIRPITKQRRAQPRTRNRLGSVLHLHSIPVRAVLVRQPTVSAQILITSNLMPPGRRRHCCRNLSLLSTYARYLFIPQARLLRL
jgi:hypothetical protein